MGVTGAVMVPHPPLIIPEVGRGDERAVHNTVIACKKAMREMAEMKPETVVVISPHSVMYSDYIHISPGMSATGDLSRFRAPEISISAEYDTSFVEELCSMAKDAGISAGTEGGRAPSLDHGTMIPLYFLNEYLTDYRLVRIGISGLPLTEHYRLGCLIRDTAEKLGRKIIVIASGDLSHKLKMDGPYGYSEEGPLYDRQIMEVMGKAEFYRLFEFPEDFCSRAAECGHRAFLIMAGALDRYAVLPERLSYEGPFGVGYGVCSYRTAGQNPERNFFERYENEQKHIMRKVRSEEDAYTDLARKSVEFYIRKGEKLSVPSGLPEEMYRKRAGVFVSMKKEGRLRGCIGTIKAVQKSLAEEIIENAVSAAVKDPRFERVMEEELEQIRYSVDVLGDPQPVQDLRQLDVRKYGVIVTKGYRRGLLLPDLEGVDTVEEQIQIAMRKAGIPEDTENVKLERFEVVRHT